MYSNISRTHIIWLKKVWENILITVFTFNMFFYFKCNKKSTLQLKSKIKSTHVSTLKTLRNTVKTTSTFLFVFLHTPPLSISLLWMVELNISNRKYFLWDFFWL